MRALEKNERIIKEYDKFILIEVACPHGESYRTTIDKWEQKDFNINKTITKIKQPSFGNFLERMIDENEY